MSSQDRVSRARRDALLYRIIDGRLKYRGHYILPPSIDLKRRAKNVFYKTLLDAESQEGILEDRDILMRLYLCNDWSQEKEDFLNKAPKKLESLKLRYFNFFNNIGMKNQYKLEINELCSRLFELSAIRHSYDSLTAEGIARGAEAEFIIKRTYRGKDKVGALTYKMRNRISEEDVRAIALSEEWSSYASLSKNPFGGKIFNLTDDQKMLLSWTNAYKNIRNHPDCPTESIIKDDIALDGWMINQSRKQAAERNKDIKLGNIKDDARNVFVFTKTDEERENIINLNDGKNMMRVEKELGL